MALSQKPLHVVWGWICWVSGSVATVLGANHTDYAVVAGGCGIPDMEPGRPGLHDPGKSGDDLVFQKLGQMFETMLERTPECLLTTCHLVRNLQIATFLFASAIRPIFARRSSRDNQLKLLQ
jgi:hypothetical protein